MGFLAFLLAVSQKHFGEEQYGLFNWAALFSTPELFNVAFIDLTLDGNISKTDCTKTWRPVFKPEKLRWICFICSAWIHIYMKGGQWKYVWNWKVFISYQFELLFFFFLLFRNILFWNSRFQTYRICTWFELKKKI